MASGTEFMNSTSNVLVCATPVNMDAQQTHTSRLNLTS